MPDHRAIFEGIESILIRAGSSCRAGCRRRTESGIRANLAPFRRVEGRRISDGEAYRLLVEVAFYSGFRAATVTQRLPTIHSHLPDHETVAGCGETEVQRIP
jgi:DNA-3-methyladenine glycosylase I